MGGRCPQGIDNFTTLQMTTQAVDEPTFSWRHKIWGNTSASCSTPGNRQSVRSSPEEKLAMKHNGGTNLTYCWWVRYPKQPAGIYIYIYSIYNINIVNNGISTTFTSTGLAGNLWTINSIPIPEGTFWVDDFSQLPVLVGYGTPLGGSSQLESGSWSRGL